jgi:hypothetical protein
VLTICGSLALSALLIGCRVYDPALAESDGAVDPTPCEPHVPPPRPTGADTDVAVELSIAMRMAVLDQDGDRWRDIGFDLDGYCTDAPLFASECAPPAGTRPEPDGHFGIDNVFGSRFYPLVALARPGFEEDAERTLEEGRGNPMFRMLGWNGTRDDPRVDVHVMHVAVAAPGPTDEPPATAPDRATSRPTWDGRDWVWARSDGFLGGAIDRPIVRDDNAYVAEGVIVARLPDRIDIVFPSQEGAGLVVRLTDGLATGLINADGTGLEWITVAGRWAINDVLDLARAIGFCAGTRDYELLVGQLDRSADVRSIRSTAGEGVSCDAVSLGVSTVGTRVRLAGLVDGDPYLDVCGSIADGGVADAGVGADGAAGD